MNYYDISFEEICISGTDAWVCNIDFSALYHIDLKTMEANIEYIFDEKNPVGNAYYTALAYYEGNLIIAPNNNSKDILIYNVEKHSVLLRIDVEEYVHTNLNQLFKQVLIRDGKAYLIPGRSKQIIVLDLKSYTIESIDLTLFGIDDWVSEPKRILFRQAKFDSCGRMVLPCFQNGKVLFVNTTEIPQTEIKEFGSNPMTDVCELGDYIYFSMRDFGGLIKYEKESGKYETIELVLESPVVVNGISNLFAEEEQIIICPRRGNAVTKWDMKSQCCKTLAIIDKEITSEELEVILANVRCCFIYENSVICNNSIKNTQVVCDMNTGVANEKKLQISKYDKHVINELSGMDLCSDTFYEGNEMKLNDFLDLLL